MSAAPVDGRVRVVVYYPNQIHYGFFVRFGESKRTGKLVPEVANDQDIRRALLLDRATAVALRNRIRNEFGLKSHVMEPRTREILFEDCLPETQRENRERVPHQLNGILIVPASLNRWAIRFPGTEFESLYDTSPEEVYEKLVQYFPRFVQYAEKYVPPPEPTAPEPEQQRSDGSRIRSGDMH